MIRRSTRIALEALVGLVLAVVLVGGAALWRLSEGPVSVDFLTSRLEAAFNEVDGPLRVEVGRTELIWGGWQRTVDLLALDWRLIGPNGNTVAQLPEVDVTLSLRALAQGVIAPTRIEVRGARLSLERDAEGSFGFRGQSLTRGLPETGEAAEGATAEETVPAELAGLLPPILDRLLAPPDPADPLTFLRAIEGRQMTVTLVDRRMGTRLQALDAQIELVREADGIAGNASLGIDLGNDTVALEATVDYDARRDSLQIATAFRDLALPALARVTSELAPLSAAELPVDGLVDLTLATGGRLEALSFDLIGGPGELRLPRFYEAPLPVARVQAEGRFLTEERRLAIEEFELDLGGETAQGPTVRARANLDLRESYSDIGIGLRLDRVQAAALPTYWPLGVADNARRWIVENVTAGTADNLELVTSLRVPADAEAEPTVNRLAGGFDLSDVELHYLRPMPPVTGLDGRADFDPDGLTFALAGGRVEAGNGETLALPDGSARIFGLSTPDHFLDLEFGAAGSLQAALALLDHDRLKLVRRLDIDAAGLSGEAEARVAMAFQLVDDLDEEDLEVSAGASMADVALPRAVAGLDVTRGDLALTLDTRQMRLVGPLQLGATPAEIDWTEYFDPQEGLRRRVTASTPALDGATRAALDLPAGERLQGPVSGTATLTGRADGTAVLAVELGLSEAAIDMPELKWRKPAGAAGSVNFQAELWEDSLVALRDVRFAAGTLAATGSASFAPDDGRLLGATIGRFQLGATDLFDIAVAPWAAPSGDGWDVRVAGGILDASRWLKDEEEPPALAAEAPPEPLTPLRLEVVRLQSVLLEGERGLEAVAVEGTRGPKGWEMLEASAEIPRRWWRARGPLKPEDAQVDRKLLRLVFGPAEAGGGYELTVEADDLGATLRALDWVDDMEGGRTRFEGTTPGPLISAPVEGQLEVREYTLVDAPLVGRILAGASLGGLGGMLAEDNGITFERGTGRLVYENGALSTDLLRAYGPALGITARGSLDTEADAIDIQGTVVPAYAINQVLGAIPILGPLLTGGRGEGVLGVTYSVDGTLDAPDVDVNPLSALAPGFLRGIFSGKIEGSEEALDALPPPGGTR